MTVDEDDRKRMCFTCVGEVYLAQKIEKDGQPSACSY